MSDIEWTWADVNTLASAEGLLRFCAREHGRTNRNASECLKYADRLRALRERLTGFRIRAVAAGPHAMSAAARKGRVMTPLQIAIRKHERTLGKELTDVALLVARARAADDVAEAELLLASVRRSRQDWVARVAADLFAAAKACGPFPLESRARARGGA